MGYSYRSSNLGRLPSPAWQGETCYQAGETRVTDLEGQWWMNRTVPMWNSPGCLTDPATRANQRLSESQMRAFYPHGGGDIDPATGHRGNSYKFTRLTKYERDYQCAPLRQHSEGVGYVDANDGTFTCTYYQIYGKPGYLETPPPTKDPYACWNTADNVKNYGSRNPVPNSNPCVYGPCQDQSALNFGVAEACSWEPCAIDTTIRWVLRRDAAVAGQYGSVAGQAVETNYVIGDPSKGCAPKPHPADVEGHTWHLEDANPGCTDFTYAHYDPRANVLDLEMCGGKKIFGCGDDRYQEYDPHTQLHNPDYCQTPVPRGCTDPAATNYREEAKIDDGSCEYPLDAWRVGWNLVVFSPFLDDNGEVVDYWRSIFNCERDAQRYGYQDYLAACPSATMEARIKMVGEARSGAKSFHTHPSLTPEDEELVAGIADRYYGTDLAQQTVEGGSASGYDSTQWSQMRVYLADQTQADAMNQYLPWSWDTSLLDKVYLQPQGLEDIVTEVINSHLSTFVAETLDTYQEEGYDVLTDLPNAIDSVMAKMETYICANYQYAADYYC